MVNKFLQYPAFLVLIPFVGGIIIQKYFVFIPSSQAIFILPITIITALYFVYTKRGKPYILIVPLFLLGVLTATYNENRHPSEESLIKISKGFTTFMGEIKDYDEYKNSIDVTINAVILENDLIETINSSIRVYLPRKSFKLVRGDSVLVKGILSLPGTPDNPGGFNFKNYYRSRGISGYIRTRNLLAIKLISKSEGGARDVSHIVRNSLKRLLNSHLSNSSASLMTALLLGDRRGLSEDSKELFIKTGVVHLLAVSGLHVGYIFGILFLAGSLLRLNRKLLIYFLLIGIIFYASLLGWQTAITRAVVMGSILLIGGLTERRSVPLNSLGIAALLILVLSPSALYEIGFQLSFIAVGSILFFNMRYGEILPLPNPSSPQKKLLRGAISLLYMTLYAQLATIPLASYYFNSFSTGSFFLNIILIPFVGILIALGIIAILSSVLYLPLGLVFFSALDFLSVQLLSILSISTNSLSKIIVIESFPLYLLLVIIGFIISLGFITAIKGRKWAMIFILLISNGIIWRNVMAFRGSEVAFMDVGQGDAVFIEGYLSKNILIDTGKSTHGVKSGRYSVAPLLRTKGISRINYLLLTHYDSDHTGGAKYIIDNFRVDTLLISNMINIPNSFIEYLSSFDEKNIPIRKIGIGDVIKLGKYSSIQVMNPPNNYIKPVNQNENNSSLVIKYKYANATILLTGDIEFSSELLLSDSELSLEANILKVPHHGSVSSSSEYFLDNVSPIDAVISVGRNNPYGHPNKDVIGRYNDRGINIYRTDRDNAVIFRSEGEYYSKYIWN